MSVQLLEHPRNVIVAFNTKCNANCLMCGQQEEGRYGNCWDLEDVQKYLGPLFERAELINIGGYGEITAIPYYHELIEWITNCMEGRIAFSTNGYAINAEELREKVRLDHVTVSLHSVKVNVYNAITRTTGRLPKVLANINRLAGAGRNYRVNLAMVVNGLNYTECVDVARYALSINVDRVNFLPLSSPEVIFAERTNYPTQIKLEGKQATEAVQSVAAATAILEQAGQGEQTAILSDTDRPLVVQERMNECTAPYRQTVIDYEGYVHPCCFLGREYSMGNIFHDDWETIWNGDTYSLLRRRLRTNRSAACVRYCRNWG